MEKFMSIEMNFKRQSILKENLLKKLEKQKTL